MGGQLQAVGCSNSSASEHHMRPAGLADAEELRVQLNRKHQERFQARRKLKECHMQLECLETQLSNLQVASELPPAPHPPFRPQSPRTCSTPNPHPSGDEPEYTLFYAADACALPTDVLCVTDL